MKNLPYFFLIAICACFENMSAQQPAAAEVIQYAEPANGRLTLLTDQIPVPEEDAGYTLILPKGKKPKGFKTDGSRHPHSWSIVDNGELVEWLLGLE